MSKSVRDFVRKFVKVCSGALLVTAGLGAGIPNAFAGTLPSVDAPTIVNDWVQVSNATELEYLDQNQSTYLSDNIELTNNIDLSGYSGWVPFGGNTEPVFSGEFDGQGYEITGLVVNDSTDINVGFFGETSGTVKNVGISDSVTGSGSALTIGGLVGQQANGVITNSYALTTASGGAGAGGLVGRSFATITDSFSKGKVEGASNYNGGLVGAENGGTVLNSYSTAAVTGSYYTGGLLGYDQGANITNTYAAGAVSGGNVGGLVGWQDNTSPITNSFYNDTVNPSMQGSATVSSQAGVTGESTSNMQSEGTYSTWNFTGTWAINASVNNGYPFFLPKILTTSLPSANTGQPYSYTLTGFDGTGGGLTWSSVNLPNGLKLSSAGVITGTPTVHYSGNIAVTATDSAGNTASSNLQLNILQVAPDIATQSIRIGTSLGSTKVNATPNHNGDTFAYVLGSTHANAPNVDDSLPTGATSYSSGSNIPNVSVGQYLDIYEVNGSHLIQAWYEYQLTSGDINSAGPVGLIHSSVTPTGWTESWSPVSGASSYNVYLNGSKAGSTAQSVYSYPFTGEQPGVTYRVQVSSVSKSGQESALSASDSVTTAVYGGGGPVPPFINTIFFVQDAKVGTSYSVQLVTTGGTQPFQWSISNGSLPHGLTLNNQGIISGTPTGLDGQYTFTVQVTDANNLRATRQLTMAVDGPISYPSITTKILPPVTVGQSYDQTLGATGGTAPYTWHVTQGTLPIGLRFNPNTGEIAGTSSTNGVSNIIVQVTDVDGMTSTQTMRIDIIQPDEREVVWNGQIQNVPAVVGEDSGTQTTYMPIWYVMQLLKPIGITSTWDGKHWYMTTSSTADLSNIKSGSGDTGIYLNGRLVQMVNTVAQVDPSTNKPTTYMPIWYVMQLLKRLGLHSTWNRTTWTVMK